MKPLLAETLDDLNELRFPVLASPKLDGIRCLMVEQDGKVRAMSRAIKPIANLHIREVLESSVLSAGFDGELMVGKTFQQVASSVMSHKGQPDFIYNVFDNFNLPYSFESRYRKLAIQVQAFDYSWLKLVEHKLINNLEELATYELEQLAAGHEGVMMRSLTGRYKYGRSTQKEQILLKLKKFLDAEAIVIGFTELQRNGNEATVDARGYTERSTAADGLAAGGTLGALICRNVKDDIQFNIGTGFTAAHRRQIWNNKEKYINKTVTYKYQPHGVKLAPRAPVFLRWRLDADA